MLNEIGEFYQYTSTNPFGNRLKYHTLIKGSFAGLERAMTIIARRVIFGLGNDVQLDVRKQKDFDEVKRCLQIWCRFINEEDPRVPTGWLPDYIKCMRSPEKSSKKIDECLDKLSGKKRQFAYSIYFIPKDKNIFRALNYDRVIANALLGGILKKKYLLCRFTNELKKFPAKWRLKKKDIVLKLTAFYLLQRQFTDQSFVVFNKANFENWMYSGKSENLDLTQFQMCFDGKSEEALFEEITDPVIKVVKLRINTNWLKHFKLVDESELNADMAKPENEGAIFFSDTGGAEPLQEKKFYQ